MKVFEKSISVLFLVLGTIVLASCSDDKDEPEVQQQPKTTYTITTMSDILGKVEADGIKRKINYTIYEYNDGNEIVNIQEWKDIKESQPTKKFIADRKATKLVIKIIFDYENSKEYHDTLLYIKTVYHLSENENINIFIDGNSEIWYSFPEFG